MQVELDALPLATLRRFYAAAIGRYFDASKYRHARRRERDDRAELRARWT